MQSPIQPSILLPVALQILQAGVLLAIVLAVLRHRKLWTAPIGAMDNSTAIFCASLVIGTLLIAGNSSGHFFRAYTYALSTGSLFRATLVSFSHYFITTLCAAILFIGLSLAATALLSQGKDRDAFSEGNMPLRILCSSIAIGLAVLIAGMATPLYEWLTPVYIDFR